MSGFRRSRVALLIDMLLLPLSLVVAVILHGVLPVWWQIRDLPRDVVFQWKQASWFSDKKNV